MKQQTTGEINTMKLYRLNNHPHSRNIISPKIPQKHAEVPKSRINKTPKHWVKTTSNYIKQVQYGKPCQTNRTAKVQVFKFQVQSKQPKTSTVNTTTPTARVEQRAQFSYSHG